MQVPQRKTDLSFNGLGCTRQLRVFEFFQSFAQDLGGEVAHVMQNHEHELGLFTVQVAANHSYESPGDVIVIADREVIRTFVFGTDP